MKLTTAGESHGKALVAIIEGLPAHMPIDTEQIDFELKLRQSGFGRGGRQSVEQDRAEILTGVRLGETLASPLTLCIYNRDYENWREILTKDGSSRRVSLPRPGHADLAGALKFSQTDARNILERASARETAIRVAAGSIFKQYLSCFGIEIGGYVREVAGIKDEKEYAFQELDKAKNSLLGFLDKAAESAAIRRVSELAAEGDTAGGVVELRVSGLKSGFGSCMTYGEKLDSLLAGELMSIQAAKGVEIGLGFRVGGLSGREAQDEIGFEKGRFFRLTDRAGGIEGGMSNGEELVVRVAMKPIPTLKRGLKSADLSTHEEGVCAYERSDVCAIFAFERIAEAAASKVLAFAVSERLGGDTLFEQKERYEKLPDCGRTSRGED